MFYWLTKDFPGNQNFPKERIKLMYCEIDDDIKRITDNQKFKTWL